MTSCSLKATVASITVLFSLSVSTCNRSSQCMIVTGVKMGLLFQPQWISEAYIYIDTVLITERLLSWRSEPNVRSTVPAGRTIACQCLTKMDLGQQSACLAKSTIAAATTAAAAVAI